MHTAGSSAMDLGLLVHGLFLFNRKMTISKNALKLSSKTLSSLTERSECAEYIFLKKKSSFSCLPLGSELQCLAAGSTCHWLSPG